MDIYYWSAVTEESVILKIKKGTAPSIQPSNVIFVFVDSRHMRTKSHEVPLKQMIL